MREFIYQNKIWLGIVISLILVILGISITFVYYYAYNTPECEECEITYECIDESITDEETYLYVDIKGAVENPGVYKIADGLIVNDAIELAGGFSKSAVTSNINLSKLVTNEMVIYVYSESEYETIDSCIYEVLTEEAESNSSIKSDEIYITSDDEDNSAFEYIGLVNLNMATIDELMTLSGIGESKAEAIIAYREETAFTCIEDLLNISGIGDSTFDAIKDSITV